MPSLKSIKDFQEGLSIPASSVPSHVTSSTVIQPILSSCVMFGFTFPAFVFLPAGFVPITSTCLQCVFSPMRSSPSPHQFVPPFMFLVSRASVLVFGLPVYCVFPLHSLPRPVWDDLCFVIPPIVCVVLLLFATWYYCVTCLNPVVVGCKFVGFLFFGALPQNFFGLGLFVCRCIDSIFGPFYNNVGVYSVKRKCQFAHGYSCSSLIHMQTEHYALNNNSKQTGLNCALLFILQNLVYYHYCKVDLL